MCYFVCFLFINFSHHIIIYQLLAYSRTHFVVRKQFTCMCLEYCNSLVNIVNFGC